MFSWGRSLYIQFVMVPLRGMDDGAGRKAIKKERLPVGDKGAASTRAGRIYAAGLSW